MGLAVLAAAIVSIVGVIVVGVLMFQVMLKPMLKAPPAAMILLTIAISLLIENLSLLKWGGYGLASRRSRGRRSLWLGEVAIPPQTLWVVGITAAVLLALYLLNNSTLVGKQMTATATRPAAASLCGIYTTLHDHARLRHQRRHRRDRRRERRLHDPDAFTTGGLFGLNGFVAAMLGGWGSSTGAVVGGFTLGILESLFTGIVPAGYKDALAFVMLIVVLYFRPGGLLGTPSARVRHDGDDVDAPPPDQPPRSWRRQPSFIFEARRRRRAAVWPLIYPSTYTMSIMTTAGLFAIMVIAVILILGQAGQLSFGHSAFYGIGAYTAAILAMKYHCAHAAACSSGALAAGVVALVIGRPVLKLALLLPGPGHHRPGPDLPRPGDPAAHDHRRRPTASAPIPTSSIFGFEFDTNMRQYYLVWVVAHLILLFTDRALKYRIGRALRGSRTSEIASSTLGVRTANWKLVAFVISAVYLRPGRRSVRLRHVAIMPGSFAFTAAVLPIVMMLIGGGSIWGGVVGAILLTGSSTASPSCSSTAASSTRSS